ncbi:MAG TPA: FAD-binding and (Fe-S)-binding domain-containing protein [Gemmatales bacterium]|nr:FAD-binding and (Fe-S)-binding domain-containing protein [Gemmatales bacterium]
MHDLADFRRHALDRHLRRELRGEVRCDETSRRLYSTDASIYQIRPVGVVLPRTVQDLVVTLQVCAEHGIPVVPRGGGTSLSGQAIGPGIVVDCSQHLNHVLTLDSVQRRVRVQPGVVLDQLNRAVASHGLQFGPDVSTMNRATLGGMIGNNSAGAHSIRHGKTLDHVRGVQVILPTGGTAWLGPQRLPSPRPPGASESHLTASDGLLTAVTRLVAPLREEIEARFPKIMRRVSGYNLDAIAAQMPSGMCNLAALIVGSEGTLGLVAEAELALVPRPRCRVLGIPHFTSREAALAALDECLRLDPSAVELLDGLILDLARDNLELKRQMSFVVGRPAAVLMVEFSGDSQAEVVDRLVKLRRRLEGMAGTTAFVEAHDDAQRVPIWRLRESGLPLLLGLPGQRKPVSFVEDAAAAAERPPEFTRRFEALLAEHGTTGAFYGHASVGCLHVRPLLDLKDAADRATMLRISTAVTDLVLEYGGSLSGEHGDGLARSQWNEKMFGPRVYEAFQAVKRLFDPRGLMNPGKIVDAPPLTENLRYGPDYHPVAPRSVWSYGREGLVGHVELCSGTGVCRKNEGGVMCPSYRATREEEHSTRGRANALRLALTQPQPREELRSPELFDTMDLCLSCKACKAECPSNVDLAKLKAEVLAWHYEGRSRPVWDRLVGQTPRLLRIGSPLAPVLTWLGTNRLMRWLAQRTLGLDARRSLPSLHRRHFRWWHRRHRPAPTAGRLGTVLLLDDCFTTYQEPQIGVAAVRLLEGLGYRVRRAGLYCCGRPLISKGFLREARQLAQGQAARLLERSREADAIVGLEPSCLLTLVDEWRDLVPGSTTTTIAERSFLVEDWLARQRSAWQASARWQAHSEPAVLHGHCHQKALVGLGGVAEMLMQVPGLGLDVLDTGCCGMAGAFGYERNHYDLSVQIAELSLLPALASAPDALVLASGTSCRHQIHDLADRGALHPVEFLAARLVPS